MQVFYIEECDRILSIFLVLSSKLLVRFNNEERGGSKFSMQAIR